MVLLNNIMAISAVKQSKAANAQDLKGGQDARRVPFSIPKIVVKQQQQLKQLQSFCCWHPKGSHLLDRSK